MLIENVLGSALSTPENVCIHRSYRSHPVALKSYVRLKLLRSVVHGRMNQTSLRDPSEGCVNAPGASFQDINTILLFDCRRLDENLEILIDRTKSGVIYHAAVMIIVSPNPYCNGNAVRSCGCACVDDKKGGKLRISPRTTHAQTLLRKAHQKRTFATPFCAENES